LHGSQIVYLNGRYTYRPISLFLFTFLLSDCGSITLTDGSVYTPGGRTYGQTATLTCNTGYTLNGPSVVECLTDGWNDTSTCDSVGECMTLSGFIVVWVEGFEYFLCIVFFSNVFNFFFFPKFIFDNLIRLRPAIKMIKITWSVFS
jgi:hypothetical protein